MDLNTNAIHNQQIYTVDYVLTKEECNNIIEQANQKGWNESSPSGGGHGRTGREEPRTNSFCVLHDNKLSSKIWNKIKETLPDDLSFLGDNVYFNSTDKGKEWFPSFIYEKIRIYKYNPGDAFPEHLDYKVKRNVIENEKEVVQQSFLSLLIYLNDDFEGGETGYWPDINGVHCRFIKNVDKQSTKKEHQIKIKPTTGLCVIQDQNILHEGLPTTKGIKYLLRTDVIHQKEMNRPDKVIIDKSKLGEWERLFETSCKNYAD